MQAFGSSCMLSSHQANCVLEISLLPSVDLTSVFCWMFRKNQVKEVAIIVLQDGVLNRTGEV